MNEIRKPETIKDKILSIRIETIVVVALFLIMLIYNITGEKFNSLARLSAVEKSVAAEFTEREALETDFQIHKEENSKLFGSINQNLETLQKQSDKILSHLLDD